VDWTLVRWLCVGSVPAAFCGALIARSLGHGVNSFVSHALGAQLSSLLPGALIRRALAFVLLASAMKTLGASNLTTGIVLLSVLVLADPVRMVLRRLHGFPAWPRHEQREESVVGAG